MGAKVWEELHQRYRYEIRGEYFYPKVLKEFRDGERVCDVGCGDMFYLEDLKKDLFFVGVDLSLPALRNAKETIKELRERRKNVIGTIRSPKTIKKARREKKVELVLADARKLPFRDKIMPIISSETFQYLVNGLEDALSECKRVGKNSVIFSLPAYPGHVIKGASLEERDGKIIFQYGVTPPKRVFGKGELEKLLERCFNGLKKEVEGIVLGELMDLPPLNPWPGYLPEPESEAIFIVKVRLK